MANKSSVRRMVEGTMRQSRRSTFRRLQQAVRDHARHNQRQRMLAIIRDCGDAFYCPDHATP